MRYHKGDVLKIPVVGETMFVWKLDNVPVVESYELAMVLGYAQHHSLRKQLFRDWDGEMEKGTDYWFVQNEADMRGFEDAWDDKCLKENMKRSLRGTKPTSTDRGYVFFSGSGIKKILSRSTKENADLLREDVELRSYFKWGSQAQLGLNLGTPEPTPEPAPEPAPEPLVFPLSAEHLEFQDRKFRYEVMQTLLEQLHTYKDHYIRELAILAAEDVLEKDLSRFRDYFSDPAVNLGSQVESTESIDGMVGGFQTLVEFAKTAGIPTEASSKARNVKHKISGPVFRENEFYSLTAIGQKAGGYSPSTAGAAANLVAGRMGHTPEAIRKRHLSFNQLPILPDSNGRLRRMFRFNKEFSNKVIHELRNNPAFKPVQTDSTGSSSNPGPDFEPEEWFSRGANDHPNLTEPLDLDDQSGENTKT